MTEAELEKRATEVVTRMSMGGVECPRRTGEGTWERSNTHQYGRPTWDCTDCWVETIKLVFEREDADT